MGVFMSIILDFHGIPGSGKSTISHQLAITMKEKGFNVIEPSYCIDHMFNPIVRKIVKLFMTIIFCLLKPKGFFEVLSIVYDNRYKKSEIIKDIVNISYKLMVVLIFKHKDYIIFDEGFVQAAISLSLQSNINVYTNFHRITNNVNNILSIYVKIDIPTAIRRMNNRCTNDSRIEKEQNIINKKKLISNFYLLSEKMGNHSNIRIDGAKNNNINKILDKIKSKLIKKRYN